MTEKWLFTYDLPNGEKSIALCNDYLNIPFLIRLIKLNDGINIVIEDKTIYFELAPKAL